MQRHSHDTPAPVRKVHELEYVAERGESDKTPLILLGASAVVWGILVVVLIAVALLAYRLAS